MRTEFILAIFSAAHRLGVDFVPLNVNHGTVNLRQPDNPRQPAQGRPTSGPERATNDGTDIPEAVDLDDLAEFSDPKWKAWQY